jgi:hypothetical protein
MKRRAGLLGGALLFSLVMMLVLATIAGAGAGFGSIEIMGKPKTETTSTYTLKATVVDEPAFDGILQMYLSNNITDLSVMAYNPESGTASGDVRFDKIANEDGIHDTYVFHPEGGQSLIITFTSPESLQMTETDGNIISRFGYRTSDNLAELVIGFAAPEGMAGVGDEVELLNTDMTGDRFFGKTFTDIPLGESRIAVVKFIDQADADRAANDALLLQGLSVEETETAESGWFSGTAWLWLILAILGLGLIAGAFVVLRLRGQEKDIDYR